MLSLWPVNSVQEAISHVHGLVEQSLLSWRTVHYDVFQKLTNGIR